MLNDNLNNFLGSPKASLIEATLWGLLLIMSVMSCIKGESPSWICTICAIACCILHSLTNYIIRR